MRYLAVTTCNADQWAKYGREMAVTFRRYWPSILPLRLYAEGFVYPVSNGIEYVDLYEAALWLPAWKILYRAAQYNGGSDRRDYRHDAVRFSHKVAAIGAAVENIECDVLIWIDADTVTHSPVTMEWLYGLFPEPAVIAWLDRDRTYPECGFVMYRMPEAREIIQQVVKSYRDGSVFKLPEWHDSYVLEHYVRKAGVAVHSLSGPEGRANIGHPWISSPLASKMDHLKGDSRKEAGRSPLTADLKRIRTEPYWQ